MHSPDNHSPNNFIYFLQKSHKKSRKVIDMNEEVNNFSNNESCENDDGSEKSIDDFIYDGPDDSSDCSDQGTNGLPKPNHEATRKRVIVRCKYYIC